MGTAIPLPVGVHTSGVVCLALVGVCITVLATALCGVVSLVLDWELFGVRWGVDSMPPYIFVLLCGALFDSIGVLGKPAAGSLLL